MPPHHSHLHFSSLSHSSAFHFLSSSSNSMAHFQASSLITLTLLFSCLSEAKDILIGGKTGAWKVPSSQADSLNKWAESSRFIVGDSLVWKYDNQTDSVLEVTRVAYLNCNVSNPIEEYKDGNTKVKLERPGPYYFISGAEDHCVKGQKMIVVVLTPRRRSINISPAPSSAELEGPAIAPTSSATGLKFTVTLVVSLGILLLGLF